MSKYQLIKDKKSDTAKADLLNIATQYQLAVSGKEHKFTSWITSGDSEVFTTELQQKEPSLKQGVPAIPSGDVMSARLIVGLFNPSIRDEFGGDRKFKRTKKTRGAGKPREWLESEAQFKDRFAKSYLANISKCGDDLSYYVEHHEDFNYFDTTDTAHRIKNNRHYLIESAEKLSVDNFFIPTNIVAREFENVERFVGNGGVKTDFKMKNEMYYCHTYFNKLLYPLIKSAVGTNKKNAERLSDLKVDQLADFGRSETDSLNSLPIANIELIPYRSRTVAKMKEYIDPNNLHKLPCARIALLIVINRALRYLSDPDSEEKPVFVLRSYRTYWRLALMSLFEELKRDHNELRNYEFSSIEDLVWMNASESNASITPVNLIKASIWVERGRKKLSRDQTKLLNGEVGESAAAYKRDIASIFEE